MEFVSLKKNYFSKNDELGMEKDKNEGLCVEIVNLVNENKELMRESGSLTGAQGTVHEDYKRSIQREKDIEAQNRILREQLSSLNSELERVQSEVIQAKYKEEHSRIDYEAKKNELEKNILKYKDKKDIIRENVRTNPAEDKLVGKYNERVGLQKNVTEFSRRNEDLQFELSELQEAHSELLHEKHAQEKQFNELRDAFRTKLGKLAIESGKLDAKSELIKHVKDREQQQKLKIEILEDKLAKMKTKTRSIYIYIYISFKNIFASIKVLCGRSTAPRSKKAGNTYPRASTGNRR